ncbi:MAG: transcriptional repressor [Pseudomonadota bacterium]
MASPTVHPESSSDDGGIQKQKPDKRLALAKNLCSTRGVRLTALRQQVLELLWDTCQPKGAYDLIDALEQKRNRKVAPPTVYRALDFLIDQGFVTKIESRNTYTSCAHPERRHGCLFFICSDCGASVEMEDPGVEQRLAEDAAGLGFQVTGRVIEVQGTCASCLAANVT